MATSSESIEQALSPLLTLPVELRLEIISHLPHDEYPSRACLRRTHSSFLSLIPKADIRSKLSDTDLANQLLKAEVEYAYLLPPDHYPCYFCARVLPLDAYSISPVGRFGRVDRNSNGGYRSCKDCCTLKSSGYKRSFIETLLWIGCTFEELPMPPLCPRLRSPNEPAVTLKTIELRRHLRGMTQQVQNHGAITEE